MGDAPEILNIEIELEGRPYRVELVRQENGEYRQNLIEPIHKTSVEILKVKWHNNTMPPEYYI